MKKIVVSLYLGIFLLGYVKSYAIGQNVVENKQINLLQQKKIDFDIGISIGPILNIGPPNEIKLFSEIGISYGLYSRLTFSNGMGVGFNIDYIQYSRLPYHAYLLVYQIKEIVKISSQNLSFIYETSKNKIVSRYIGIGLGTYFIQIGDEWKWFGDEKKYFELHTTLTRYGYHGITGIRWCIKKPMIIYVQCKYLFIPNIPYTQRAEEYNLHYLSLDLILSYRF